MCDQSLQRVKEQQEAIYVKQEEQVVQNQTLMQENQTVTAQEEQTLARRMAEGLPEAGAAAPVPGAQQEVTAEQMEAKTKRERRLRRERMEEERRIQEEERRIQEQETERQKLEEQRLLQEREAAEEERVRQRQRELILGDDEVRGLLEQTIREQNREKAMKAAQTFLHKAAEKLLEADQELKKVYGGTVDYVGEVTPFRLLVYSQMGDTKEAEALFRESLTHEERFGNLSKEREVCSLVSWGIDDILKEEFLAEPLLARAAEGMADQLEEQNEEQMRAWAGFEQKVAEEVGMSVNGGKTTNVFHSESPYKYLIRKETREAFEARTEELMKKSPLLTRAEAQKQAALAHREELREKAMKITLDNGVVPGVKKEDWERHGGASFHYTLPAAQAYEAVSESNGFLYARPCGDGLCELRPTLPETVQINGESVPLRRTYTLFIKALIEGILDKNGELKDDAKAFAEEVAYCFAPACQEKLETRMDSIRPALEEVLKNKDQADQVLKDLFQLCDKSKDGTIFVVGEIMGAFEETVLKIQQASEGKSLVKRLDTELKKVVGSQRTDTLTKEQDQQIGRIVSVYADINQAVTEMLRIRRLGLDSQETPLPNTCSAHGAFIMNIRRNLLGEAENTDNEQIVYRPREHVKAEPEIHIRYIVDHFDELKGTIERIEREKSIEEKEKRIEKIGEKGYFEGLLLAAGQGTLKPEDLQLIQRITVDTQEAPAKYPYHVAGNIGKLGEGARMTTEGFAAETKQYMVSPFSISHAVGIYRGEEKKQSEVPQDFVHSGMLHYYNHDNPLTTDEEREQVKVNHAIRFARNEGGR